MFTKYAKRFYLEPADGRASFYNKCFVELIDGEAVLYSYNVIICIYNLSKKTLFKTKYFNYSATTKRHQKSFFNFYDITPEIIESAEEV